MKYRALGICLIFINLGHSSTWKAYVMTEQLIWTVVLITIADCISCGQYSDANNTRDIRDDRKAILKRKRFFWEKDLRFNILYGIRSYIASHYWLLSFVSSFDFVCFYHLTDHA